METLFNSILKPKLNVNFDIEQNKTFFAHNEENTLEESKEDARVVFEETWSNLIYQEFSSHILQKITESMTDEKRQVLTRYVKKNILHEALSTKDALKILEKLFDKYKVRLFDFLQEESCHTLSLHVVEKKTHCQLHFFCQQ